YNVILILGLCSIVEPMKVDFIVVFDCIAMIASVAVLFIFSLKNRKVNRWQGIVMIAIYAVYLTIIILRNIGLF
ncbi:MAG: hypothetical protein IJA65_01895, partial [Acholeplasmatales bacterium]|nr:hypothetical protein [Acholeplasmatales bacterium]